MCTQDSNCWITRMQDWRQADYDQAGRCMCMGMCLTGRWRGWAAERPLLSRITSIPASLLKRGTSFGEQKKLKRIWNCAKYLHVEKKLVAGFFRDIERNTNCITIATVCLILSLPLLNLTLVLNIQILIWPLYKQTWNNDHISCLSYSIEIHVEYLLGLKLKPLNRS